MGNREGSGGLNYGPYEPVRAGRHPFFTENHLVCCFHRLLHETLVGRGAVTVSDRDGKPHGLIHCDYPTPFRCDMGGRFEVKTDDDLTPSRGKHRRRRFDVAVLNPSFIGSHRYATIKGQNYAAFRSSVLTGLVEANPIVLYGIEFVFRREEIKPSKGKDWERAADRFVAGVRQDAEKLKAAVATKRYMHRAVLMAFIKRMAGKVMDSIRCGMAGLAPGG